MGIQDKVIWSNSWGYEVGWIQTIKEGEALIKLICDAKDGVHVNKPMDELEMFTEEAYQHYSKLFGGKFGE